MAETERLICASADLQEKSLGIRFPLPEFGDRAIGFVVRYNGRPYGYVNSCAHVPVELDWQEGEFFDLEQQYLICATHGAHYVPETGICVFGPCQGRALQPLTIVERDDGIYLRIQHHV